MEEYQRVVAEIDLDAIAFNIQSIRKKVGPGTKIIGIVKADAYGHGAEEVSKVLLENGADCLGVAILEEGIALRKSGVKVPILELGYTSDAKMDEAVKYDIIQTVFSCRSAEKISQEAKKQQKNAQIHIKVDTGMGRLGFFPSPESVEEIWKISKLPNVEIDGMYTHFSTADEENKDFTWSQKEKFDWMIEALKTRGLSIAHCHCANSAGIVDFDTLTYDMVRPGIILYGLYPSSAVHKENLPLRPAMSLKTHISFIKSVEPQTPIGYGREFVTERKSVIATVPVGYGDGFQRGMAKGGRVLVGGCYAPVVGRVCMDQFMIDITHIPHVQIDDEVVIIGKQGKNEITADEIAGVMGTICYETVCLVSKRVPRVYKKDGQIIKTVSYV